MAIVKVGSARGDEKGRAYGGKAGDQTGKEVSTQNWYKHSKGWVLVRCKNSVMRYYIADAMEKACANGNIGYDQHQNQTLWNQAMKVGFDPSKVTKKCETDCARLVRLCAQYACEQVGNGKLIPDFYTATLATTLKNTGLFIVITDAKHTTMDDYLLRGDILVTKTKGHTVVVLNDGDKAEIESGSTLGSRVLSKGDKGKDVEELQRGLKKLKYPLGDYGANKDGIDGSFGLATEKAVMDFQQDNGLEIDGQFGPKSFAAYKKAIERSNKTIVEVTDGSVNVREKPTTSAEIVFVAHYGETYTYGGETAANGWNSLIRNGKKLWISGKYSELK